MNLAKFETMGPVDAVVDDLVAYLLPNVRAVQQALSAERQIVSPLSERSA